MEESYDDDDFEGDTADEESTTNVVKTEQPVNPSEDVLGASDLDRYDQQTRTLAPNAASRVDAAYSEEDSQSHLLTGADADLASDGASAFSPGAKSSVTNKSVIASKTAGGDTGQHEETISKLRVANSALRYQIKEFSRALDASLQTAGRAVSAGSGFKAAKESSTRNGDAEARKSLRAMLQTKTKMFETTKKKLEIYKKTNTELKRQLREAFKSDRLERINNENAEKEREIQSLLEENRSLLNVQRNQAREIERAEANRDEYPARLASLSEDLRVAKEKLRMVRERSRKEEAQQKKQHAQLMALIDKNKALQAEVKRYEKSGGKAKSKTAIEAEGKKKAWGEEKEKLKRKIALLEKSNRQERTKMGQAMKKANEEITRSKERLQRLKAQLEEKEREMRMQVLQVKKLKRHLREIALGGAPLPTGPAPWAQNMAAYGGTDDEDRSVASDEGDLNSSPGKPVPPSGASPGRAPRPHRGHERHRDDGLVAGTRRRGGSDAEAWNEAACKVQASYRGRLGRKEGVKRRRRQERHRSAVQLQALHRGRLERKRHGKRQQRRHTAATTLQSRARGRAARNAMARKKAARAAEAEADGLAALNTTDDYDDESFADEPPVETKPPSPVAQPKKVNAFAKPGGLRKKKKKNIF